MKSLEQVMDEHPNLNFEGCRNSPLNPYATLADKRRYLSESMDRIEAAVDYLMGLPVVKVTSRRARSSYELKHKAERTPLAMQICNGYISNGCLIAAAYMLDLEVKPSGIDAVIGVSWGEGER